MFFIASNSKLEYFPSLMVGKCGFVGQICLHFSY